MTRKPRLIPVLFLAALGAAITPAAAQSAPAGPWSVAFGAGTTPSLNGVYHEAGSGTVLGLPTEVGERSWSDIYGTGFTMSFGVGYHVTERAEVVGLFQYSRQDAEELSVGTVAGLNLRSQFGDYRDWSVEGGVRWHFATDARVSPYVGLAGGFRRVEAMPATFSVPAASVVLADTPFYDQSTLPTFGGDFGVEFAVAPAVRLGAQAGLRWTDNLTDLEGLAGTGLENLNDTSSRWTMPVQATVSFRF